MISGLDAAAKKAVAMVMAHPDRFALLAATTDAEVTEATACTLYNEAMACLQNKKNIYPVVGAAAVLVSTTRQCAMVTLPLTFS